MAYRWVHVDVVNAVSQMFAVVGLFLSLNEVLGCQVLMMREAFIPTKVAWM